MEKMKTSENIPDRKYEAAVKAFCDKFRTKPEDLSKMLASEDRIAKFFIIDQDQFEGMPDLKNHLNVAGDTLVRVLEKDIPEARYLFGEYGFPAEGGLLGRISKFKKLESYPRLLNVARTLLENEIQPNYDLDKTPVPAGRYLTRVEFIDRNGELRKVDLQPIDFSGATSRRRLNDEAVGWICMTGLHNFGLDARRETYPLGQKVNFVTKSEDGKVEYSSFCYINESGNLTSSNAYEMRKEWKAEVEKVLAKEVVGTINREIDRRRGSKK